MLQKKLFVISLGGSRINPGQVDTNFLKKFRALILSQIKKDNRFIIVTGGGKLSRHYQESLKKITQSDSKILDWMGIYTTRVNARLVQLMFNKFSHREIVKNPNEKIVYNEPILVSSGWKPGRSTDDVSVRLAATYGANKVINLFDQDYVYTKDPRKFNDAKKIESVSWANFRKIVGNKWNPGKNAPFDPIAAKHAQQLNLQVIIANGRNLANLKNILEGKKFKGTLIN